MQKYTSKKTSMNIVSRVYNQTHFEVGSVILDYGGGKYNTNTDKMASIGVECKVYDPYNRTKEHNDKVIDYFRKNGAKHIVCANVLNVIQEDSIILEILQDIKSFMVKGSSCYIQVYEGNRTNIGKVTIKGYQRNQKVKNYERIIHSVFKKSYKISKKLNIISIYKKHN